MPKQEKLCGIVVQAPAPFHLLSPVVTTGVMTAVYLVRGDVSLSPSQERQVIALLTKEGVRFLHAKIQHKTLDGP